MQVTLKRADFYARAALKAATETKYETTARLSIYATALLSSDPGHAKETVTQVRAKLLDRHELSIKLIAASYAIRAQLAIANLEHGISANLNKMKALATEEGRMLALLKAHETGSGQEKTVDAALARAKALREQPVDRYSGRDDVVSIAVVADSDADGWRSRLARIVDQRSEVNDALTAANVSHFIELDRETIETLRRAAILTT